ncbi:unnamed protein product [Prunus armeniaca]|uniref:Uncharacterized protein n=1 Tax=Prunus armeniaca TaxID=36596 RepID=A0A6J5TH15_PRUAR|nr:unnamed protein product [Prunus armeniaca]
MEEVAKRLLSKKRKEFSECCRLRNDRWLDVRFPEFRLDSVVVSPVPTHPESCCCCCEWLLQQQQLVLHRHRGPEPGEEGQPHSRNDAIASSTFNQDEPDHHNFSLAMVRSYVGKDMANELLMGVGSRGCYGAARLGVKLFGELTFMVPPQGNFRDL